ncbi:MAG: LURP-one-related family protein [Thermomicrobiales bacterium]
MLAHDTIPCSIVRHGAASAPPPAEIYAHRRYVCAGTRTYPEDVPIGRRLSPGSGWPDEASSFGHSVAGAGRRYVSAAVQQESGGQPISERGTDMLRRNRREGGILGNQPTANRYRMVEKIAAIGDDFFIENSQGQRVFKVDGKALRLRDTLIFRDAQGNELCKIQSRVARVRESMEIEDPNGHRIAMVHKAMISPLRDRFVAKIGDGPDLEIQGNILAHEYRIGNVATVSRKWFRIRDSYGVEVEAGQNDILVLAITVCIDQMTSDVA